MRALWGGVVLGIVLFAACPRAEAQGVQDFLHAKEAYDAGNFPLAVTRFEALVGGAVPRLSNPLYIAESRKLLGASYVLLGRTALAEGQFEQLLNESPEARIDPVTYPGEVVELFEGLRERRLEEARRAREEARRREDEQRRREAEALLRERERLQRLRDLATSETVERRNSRLLATVPFGVGQFQNGDDTLGWTLAISEGVLAIGSLATFLIHQAIPPDDRFEGTEGVVRVSNWIVTSAFATLAVAGIVQAHLEFVPTVTETRERELPDDLDFDPDQSPQPVDVAEPDATLSFGIGPGTAAATLTF